MTTDKDPGFVELLYASTLDPNKFDSAVEHWIDRVGLSLAGADEFTSPHILRHMQMALSVLEQLDQSLDTLPETAILTNAKRIIERAGSVARSELQAEAGKSLQDRV